MSVLNRSTRRLASAAAVGAFGIAIALGATGCSAGKISQTANQAPAVPGAAGTIQLAQSAASGDTNRSGNIAVRNVHILYPTDKADAIFGDGGPFEVAFLISNDSANRIVKLDSITTKTGDVKVTPPTDGKDGDPARLRPNSALQAGEPAGVLTGADDDTEVPRFSVVLNNTGKTVAAGLTTPLTFNFTVYDLQNKKLETVSTTIDTPVDGGTLPDRQDVVRDRQGE